MTGLTRQQAINAFCKQCIYDAESGDGNWRQQIQACASKICPLWSFRPQSRPKKIRVDVDPILSEKMRNMGKLARKTPVQ